MLDGDVELIGYADRLSVQPGDTVEVKVSTDLASYEAQIVRLVHGNIDPRGPGHVEHELDGHRWHDLPGRRQRTRAGSYVTRPDVGDVDWSAGVTLATWAYVLRPGDETQTLVATDTLRIVLRPDLQLAVEVEGEVTLLAPLTVARNEWFHVAASHADGVLRIAARPHAPRPGFPAEIGAECAAPAPAPTRRFTAGAQFTPDGPTSFFTGKLEAPELHGAEPVVRWDFGRDQHTAIATDVSGHARHGTIVNAPMRAVTGRTWDGTETSFRHAPDQYAAIHLHDDDLEDARWATDFTWTVPDDLPSGVYAARLQGDTLEDHVPFVVRPPKGTATAEVGLLLPTLTYLAYANERFLTRDDLPTPPLGSVPLDVADHFLMRHPELASSVYDVHRDHSGVCHSTALRPIPNLRPGHRFWLTDGPERLSADLAIVHWLEHHARTPHDVFTDHDLHAEGAPLLKRYRVILTGTHPEYWTTPMRAALTEYLQTGGRLMYLGGNGFYWVTSIDPERPHLIELRRGTNGTRSWTSAPGELHHSTTGELGALWRSRGQWPNQLVGSGFAAQTDEAANAAGYVRLPASHDPRVAFVFEGIGDDEVIGEFGLVCGGAAGYELDRADVACHTPDRTLVLATSQGRHNDAYLLVIEDCVATDPNSTGTTSDRVRADMTYLEHAGGGRVFGVGSITWCAALAWNGYDNNVARVTTNVLRGFLA